MSAGFIFSSMIMPYHALPVFSPPGQRLPDCQPAASSLRGQSSRSSWGKPPPCRNSPVAYGCSAGRGGEGRKVKRVQRQLRLNPCVLKSQSGCLRLVIMGLLNSASFQISNSKCIFADFFFFLTKGFDIFIFYPHRHVIT